MAWNFFNREEQHNVPNDPEVHPKGEQKPPEKTTAELIAESLKPITDSLSTITTTMGEFRTGLDEVRAGVKRPVKAANEEAPQGPPSVFDDENAAFAMRVGPVYMRQLEIEARLAKGEVKAEYTSRGYSEAWTQFEAQIDATLDASPLVDAQGKAVRGDKVYIRNVVDMVFGREAMKANLKFGGRDRGFFVETAGGSADIGAAGPVDDGLTADQRRVFARMKGPDGKAIPSDDIKKTMSKLKFVN